MADPVYTIVPNPHWVIIDNFSQLPNGAAIYTYRNKNPTEFKPAYRDSGGQIPYDQPITGFGNGTMPPIYWEFDPDNPDETYYIRVYDSQDETTQQFLWDFRGLSGLSGGGGGTVVSSYDIENLIINGVFYRNSGNQASLPLSLTLAPSNNAGFVNDTANVNVTNNGPVSGDIIFAKSNTNATDNISYVEFSPLGTSDLAPDQTPLISLRYQCTASGGEAYKYIQFPISLGVQNLSGQTVTGRIYAKSTSGADSIILNWRQFFGSPAASNDVITQISTIALTSDWAGYSFNSVIPSVTTKTIGSCKNDALFFQVAYPLASTCDIYLVKAELFLGSIPPHSGSDFHSNDSINAIVNSPRTGDTRTSLNSVILGWVLADDGTIGSATSGATNRANVDTFPLFSLLWNLFNGSATTQAYAPMFTNAGVPVAYGANATADFVANRRLSLTRNLGRVMAGALPLLVSQAFTNVGNILTLASTASFYTGVPVVVSGGALPTPLVAGTTYYAIQLNATTMSLASSPENAIAGTAIVLTSNAGGTITVSAHALGSFLGEEKHTQTTAELASHNHAAPGTPSAGTPSFIVSNVSDLPQAVISAGVGTSLFPNTASTGSSTPFNVMQPTVFMNVFFKL